MYITARDQQDTMMRYLGSQTNPEAVIDCRTAIINALNEIWGKHEWPWYQNQSVMQLNAPYLTGTVQYVASTRRFTLTGGTWPTWATYGCIKIGTKDARVTKRISDTVIEIEAGTPYLDDISTDTTYVLYRNEYPVPSGIRKASYVFLEENAYQPIQYLPSLEFRAKVPGTYGGVPLFYTEQRDRNLLGGLNFVFWPYPTRAYTARFSYVREANQVQVWEYSDGKVTTVADTAAITGVGTAFDSSHEGCLFRLGRDGVNVPTARHAGYPFLEETKVDTVTSGTVLDLLPAPANAKTSVKYCISSLIDIDWNLLSSAFTLQCYYEISKIRHLPDRDSEALLKQLTLAVRDAKSRSNPSQEISYAGSFSNLRRYAGVWFNIGV